MLRSVDDGARALLTDAMAIVSEFSHIDYMVIGGWCPVLRNKSDIPHPGTLDVDILFNIVDETLSLAPVIEAMIDGGFAPSAKHPFQLLKSQEVNGTPLVYNIDLLHPNMMDDRRQRGMFVDHLELDIPINKKEKKLKLVSSIVLPNSAALFSSDLFRSREEVDGVKFWLVNFTGMFLTKIDSCQKQKRERDSFDIVLALYNNDVDFWRVVYGLSMSNQLTYRLQKSLKGFEKFLREDSKTFNNNVRLFCADIDTKLSMPPAEYVLWKISQPIGPLPEWPSPLSS